MFYKLELLLNGNSYDATRDLVNWDDIETAVKRSSLGGAVRSFSSNFELCGASRTVVESAFMSRGLNNDISVSLYVQNNSWLWNLVFSAKADMSTVVLNERTVSFSCMDDAIDSLLKSKKSTKYEYFVSDMEPLRMSFGRLLMNNKSEFTFAPKEVELYQYGHTDTVSAKLLEFSCGWTTLPIYNLRSSIPVGGSLEFNDEQQEFYRHESQDDYPGNDIRKIPPVKEYICKSVGVSVVRIRMFLSISGFIAPSIEGARTDFTIGLYVFSEKGKYVSTIRESTYDGYSAGLSIDQTVRLTSGQRIVAMVGLPYSYVLSSGVYNFNTMSVPFLLKAGYSYSTVDGMGDYTIRFDWEDKGNAVTFDSIRPVKMLQSLVDSICGQGRAVARIIADEDNLRLNNCVLVPGESVREFPLAKVYSSFSQFCSFMETLFGYVYYVSGNEVRFVHRDKLFTDSSFEIEGARDFEISVDNGMIYSGLEVGHEKIEYGEDNGLNEINFKQSFTTGRSITDNILSMDSGYRVDAYGMEYLVEMRSEPNKDNKSDSSVFAVNVSSMQPPVTPDTSISVYNGERLIEGYFNVLYHPRYCIDANKAYLATFADVLTFASSEGNTSLSSGIKYTLNIDIRKNRKYTPYVLRVTTPYLHEIDDINGLVKVHDGNREYYGWISQYGMSFTKVKETKYSIILSSQSIG